MVFGFGEAVEGAVVVVVDAVAGDEVGGDEVAIFVVFC